jgi:Fic family protein
VGVVAAAYRPFADFAAWGDIALTPLWNDFAERLETAKASADDAAVAHAIEVAARSAALETGAIEGLYGTSRGVTRTVALQGAMWEAALDELGADVRGHFEAQLAAFDLVLDAATSATPLSEVWLRSLHAQVTANQHSYRVLTEAAGWQDRELEHGVYKSDPNHVTLADGSLHVYAPPSETASEMHRLMLELRSEAFAAAAPATQAAFAHHALTVVHPFPDGNGRTARALASVFLYRSVGIPLVIFSDQQEPYWDALAAADAGDVRTFVDFVEDRALDTMALVADRLRDAAGPLERRGSRFRSMLASHGGLSHGEVESVGQRLFQRLQAVTSEAVSRASLPEDVSTQTTSFAGGYECDFGGPYTTLQSGGRFVLNFRSSTPVEVASEATPIIGVATEVGNRFAFVVIDANRPASPPLRLRVSDLHPQFTAAADELISGWVTSTVHAALDELERGFEQQLRGRGFAR